MKVTVTAEDIRAGRGFLAGEVDADGVPVPCPLLLALRRVLGRNDVALGSGIHLGAGPYATRVVPFPPDVAAWLVQFDAGRSVRPATFDVEGLP